MSTILRPSVAALGLGIVLAFVAAADAQSPARPAVSAAQHDWNVLLKVRNEANGWFQASTRLGQMTAIAAPGFNPNDLPSLAPFSTPYLYISFPHPEWGAQAGDYATDFRPFSATEAQSWTFQINANPTGGVVTLSWEADPAILARSTLTDVANNATINLGDAAYAGGVPVNISAATQAYVWTYTPPFLPPVIR